MCKDFYKAVLNLFMCADDKTISDKDRKEMLYFLNQKARDFGYKDWLEAYHKI